MSSFFCFKFHISWSLTNSHLSKSKFKNRELPKVRTASGTPRHFFTISFPISARFGYFFSSPSLKAHLTKRDKQLSSERPSNIYEGTVPIIEAIELLRVVTKILLPTPPTFIRSLNSIHFARSSFHISSKTSKYF
ncbi:hypothetical protein Fmac_029539 [Flemingia macrophylla]|uniref:Uncharacterized protein n=1 Tax=Flemingia macrophylla TaxID=520843 RepID=A0ABD1LC97_9FABA